MTSSIRLLYYIFFLLLLFVVSGNASGSSHGHDSYGSNQCKDVQGQLWIEIIGGDYVNGDPDPWLNDGWVTTSTSFKLNVSYHKNGASGDVEEIHLIIAVDKNPVNNVTIEVNGDEIDGWKRVDSHKVEICGFEYPPHGIYGGDVWYATYQIEFKDDDEFSPGEYVLVDVNIIPENPVKVHFDAVGCGDDSHMCNTKAIVFAPPSHDATYYNHYPIPEFQSILLPAALLLGAVLISLRSR